MGQVAGGSGARSAAERFALGGRIVSVAPLGEGHINATYAVVAGGAAERRRYVLQRMNRTVFLDPETVIRNAERVAAHVAARVRDEGGDPEREALSYVPTRDGESFLRDAEGEVWRCSRRIEGASVPTALTGPSQAYAVAETFGRFLHRLADFPPGELEVGLPGFHEADGYLRALRDVAGRDPLHRAAGAGREIAFIEGRSGDIEAWAALLASGELPRRTIHGDTKINNVLLDDETGRGVCAIDLDTVMAGSPLIDIGDCSRSTLAWPEDIEKEVDLRLFGAVVRGFANEAGSLLGAAEVERIVEATRALALELAARFLADFLAGDRWFPVARPGVNLARCRVQIELVRGIEARRREMEKIVRRAELAFRARMRQDPERTKGEHA